MTIMIGIDPYKATHTAVAVDDNEAVLDELKLRASNAQAQRLRDWAGGFENRQWAIESANGLGYLLAQQLVAAGETVFDVPPVLASRVRLLGSGRSQKNDPNDARSVAIAALRSERLSWCDQTATPEYCVYWRNGIGTWPDAVTSIAPGSMRCCSSSKRVESVQKSLLPKQTCCSKASWSPGR